MFGYLVFLPHHDGIQMNLNKHRILPRWTHYLRMLRVPPAGSFSIGHNCSPLQIYSPHDDCFDHLHHKFSLRYLFCLSLLMTQYCCHCSQHSLLMTQYYCHCSQHWSTHCQQTPQRKDYMCPEQGVLTEGHELLQLLCHCSKGPHHWSQRWFRTKIIARNYHCSLGHHWTSYPCLFFI